MRNVEFCTLDTRTAECKTLIEEGFQRANISTQSVRYLKDRDELIWWSERSGWGHFYLYSKDGKFKNAITTGPFRASRIVEVDEDSTIVVLLGDGQHCADADVREEGFHRVGALAGQRGPSDLVNPGFIYVERVFLQLPDRLLRGHP